jgi:hypothetical protein
MNVLLIVYHKMTGVTRQMALAAAEAARSEVEVRMQAAQDTSADDVLQADDDLRQRGE